jgi:signal transduction histidine kinase
MPTRATRWYRSFYWRIAATFVALVVLVLVAQGFLSNYLTRIPSSRSANNLAALVAIDVGRRLAAEPGRDLNPYLRHEYAGDVPIYVILRDGGFAANTGLPLDGDTRRSLEALIAGRLVMQPDTPPRLPTPLVVTAPVQVNNELRGLVVLPPPPGSSPLARNIQRVLSLPGTVILIIATLIVAPLVFGPARRRLLALERAADRLGAGDLEARAPETGQDEVSRLAAAFNRMAADLKARDTALRDSDRLRRQMLADVSHELRTPLTSMLGFIDTLRMPDVALDQPTRERYLGTIERETRRLDRLVRDLLDLARLQSEAGALDKRVFATSQLFKHVADRHEHETRARRITVRTLVDDPANQMFADPDRIEQVVENLFANALRHTPDGGTIELHGTTSDKSIVLRVIDSGEGIPNDHLAHIFDRFYKADPARASVEGGSGLGLSIAKAIVERHMGMIVADSKPGHTVFTIVLPKATDALLDVGEFVANAPRRQQ